MTRQCQTADRAGGRSRLVDGSGLDTAFVETARSVEAIWPHQTIYAENNEHITTPLESARKP